jgi:outer membrane protein OmpA-like peptidoglycan-associated protein
MFRFPFVALRAAAALLLGNVAIADESKAPQVERFIGCPVYRDTDAGRKSGCWLVDDPATGVRYDVTGGRLKPILGQMILVEGAVAQQDARLCGGVILEPVSVSVLPQTCKPHLIPAEGHPGRRFALPANVMQPSSVPRVLPPPPYEPKTYTILFELNSDFLVYQYSETIIESAVLYTKASKPRRVLISGYAATRPIEVSGQSIREDIAIARARAQMVAEAFRRLGVPADSLEIEWKSDAETKPAGDGLTEAARRRVEIRIEP